MEINLIEVAAPRPPCRLAISSSSVRSLGRTERPGGGTPPAAPSPPCAASPGTSTPANPSTYGSDHQNDQRTGARRDGQAERGELRTHEPTWAGNAPALRVRAASVCGNETVAAVVLLSVRSGARRDASGLGGTGSGRGRHGSKVGRRAVAPVSDRAPCGGRRPAAAATSTHTAEHGQILQELDLLLGPVFVVDLVPEIGDPRRWCARGIQPGREPPGGAASQGPAGFQQPPATAPLARTRTTGSSGTKSKARRQRSRDGFSRLDLALRIADRVQPAIDEDRSQQGAG